MDLMAEEAESMRSAGTNLLSVEEPTDHNRVDAIYPASFQINPETETIQWLVEKGRECEPLAAGVGRYMLIGACGHLAKTDDGWEYCGNYTDRPRVCKRFEERGAKCVLLRKRAGLS